MITIAKEALAEFLYTANLKATQSIWLWYDYPKVIKSLMGSTIPNLLTNKPIFGLDVGHGFPRPFDKKSLSGLRWPG